MTPQLTAAQRVRIAELLPIARRGFRHRVTLRQHLLKVDPGPWLNWWHVGKMLEHVQAVLDGEIERLVINAPPRSWKSRPVVQGGTACRLRAEPRAKIMVACASDDLVRYHSRHAKDQAVASGVAVRSDSKAADLWETEAGGTYKAITVAAGRVGFGWDLGVIDDPFSSMESARNLLKQRRTFRWIRDDFMARAQDRPEGGPAGLILNHQRLTRGDLWGRVLLWLEETGAEEWTVLVLKGYAERKSVVLPACCTLALDERLPGQPLCDDPGVMREIERRRKTNPQLHRAVDQQDPPEEESGGVFCAAWFRVVEPVANMADVVRVARGWDFSAGGTDSTASTKGANCGEVFRWLDMTVGHPAPAQLGHLVKETARADGREVEVILPDEPAIGKVFAVQLSDELRSEGFTVHLAPQRGPKRSRALAHAGLAAARCERCHQLLVPEDAAEVFKSQGLCSCPEPAGSGYGSVEIVRGAWNEPFTRQHQGFTGEPGGKDDIVDAGAVTFNVCSGRPGGGATRGRLRSS